MKGIYLTEEGKKEIEAKIDKINGAIQDLDVPVSQYAIGRIMIDAYKEILSSATILPVEEDWNDVYDCVYSCKSNYQNGVIIKPKE
jgi:hemoglobin-like flavoprotein